ncbi:MAG TPA: GDSL-type esterase/lipase family protein [Allosphingosinicella sp.]|jgi:lysophospholipase L1-like esterase
MITLRKLFVLLAGIAALSATPAQPQTVGVMDKPCAGLPGAPADVAAYLAQRAAALGRHVSIAPPTAETLKRYTAWQAVLRESDFAALCRYQAENALLPAAGHHRVVFFGDSITELWRLNAPELFTNDVIGRGISGQTTEQMLIRFRADVIDLKPEAVHILAGTNDIAGNTGATSLPWVEANIQTMVEIAKAHGIKVILAAVPPAARFSWHPELKPAATIMAYNRWLRHYAARQRITFADYQAILDDGHGGFAASLTGDGVHPNASGYALMTQQARRAMARARAKQTLARSRNRALSVSMTPTG